MKPTMLKSPLKQSFSDITGSKSEVATYERRKAQFMKQIVIDNGNQIERVNSDFDKYTFKIFDRETLQECSKRGGYFDNKIVSFEKPFGQQLKRDCIIISKYIHSKCLFVKGLSIILPELDTHLNQTIDVDDETIQKLFSSIGEVGVSGKLEHLELDFKSWKKCTDLSITYVAQCFSELFTKGKNLNTFIINLNNWKEVTESGAILLAQSLTSMKYKSTSLLHLNLSFEAWTQCTPQAAEEVIVSVTDIVQKAHFLETFKFSLWNWVKCNDRSCELISQLMMDLSVQNKRLQNIDFNFFGWTKCTNNGLEELCVGVTSLFQSLNSLLNFNLNISGQNHHDILGIVWRGITSKGIDLISLTFRDCLFNLQPYLVDANITFSKSDKILSTCSKFLRTRFMARMQFLAFYKNIDWHINNPTQVSHDLYIDTLNKQPELTATQQELKEAKVQIKANVKMPAYLKNQSIKTNEKSNQKKMKF